SVPGSNRRGNGGTSTSEWPATFTLALRPRVLFIQIGESAGRTISLPAATLRSSGLELLGSGSGSASLDAKQIRAHRLVIA
ncbi:MAG: hypothetical protein WBQ89_18835, partial [Candidatus Acidiferrum sp.]